MSIDINQNQNNWRDNIDKQLYAAGWAIQHNKKN